MPSPFSTDPFSGLEPVLDAAAPEPAALEQLGHALMTEVLDVVADTSLEAFQCALAEGLIGAFQSVALRLQRDWDRAADTVRRISRDFDGSEVADVELQEATVKAHAAEAAVDAVERIRDAASAAYTVATGEVWSPWRGSVRRSACTAAQIDARAALQAKRARAQAASDPGTDVVAFRGAPRADTAIDASRIFDALNWARAQRPAMKLGVTGLAGAERLAMRWAQQKGVDIILAKPDFERHRTAAPFRANDALLALEPVLVLTLSVSLDEVRRTEHAAFGPALNLGQKAEQAGVRHIAIGRGRTG